MSAPSEVRMILLVERLHAFLAHQLELVGHEIGEVDELYACRFRQLCRPHAVVTRPALDLAIRPDVAHGERQHDGRCAPRLRLGDHPAHVPAEGVHHLVPLREEVVDCQGVVDEAWNGAARTRRVVDGACVVVAELDEHDVARLHIGNEPVPHAFGDEGAAAPSSARAVDDVHLRRVEVPCEGHPPSLLSFAGAARRRGVAGNEDRRQRGVQTRRQRWLGGSRDDARHRRPATGECAEEQREQGEAGLPQDLHVGNVKGGRRRARSRYSERSNARRQTQDAVGQLAERAESKTRVKPSSSYSTADSCTANQRPRMPSLKDVVRTKPRPRRSAAAWAMDAPTFPNM